MYLAIEKYLLFIEGCTRDELPLECNSSRTQFLVVEKYR